MSVPKVQAQRPADFPSPPTSSARSIEIRTESAFVSFIKSICCSCCSTPRKIDLHQEDGDSHELPAAKQITQHDQVTPLRLQPLSLSSSLPKTPEDVEGEESLPFTEDYALRPEGIFRIPASDFNNFITISRVVISLLPALTDKRPDPPLPDPYNTYIGSNKLKAKEMISIAQIENESYRFPTALGYLSAAVAIFKEELEGVSSGKKKKCTDNIAMLESILGEWELMSREEAPSAP